MMAVPRKLIRNLAAQGREPAEIVSETSYA